uniref:C2 domain-containing protein n=1 Tax=Opuntia streptacantha TaxID=393608 RepID=A0A7C9AP15_OPUST
MGYKTLELTLISAKDLKNVNLIGKMDPYVVVYLSDNPNTKQKTPVHQDAGTNPVWNYTMRFTVDEAAAYSAGKYLVFKIKHEQTFGADKELGEVLVSLKELFDGAKGKDSGAVQNLTYQVRRSSGKPKGELKFSCKIVDMGQTHTQSYDYGKTSTCTGSSAYAAAAPVGYPPPSGAGSVYPPPGPSQGYPAPGTAAAQPYPPPPAAGYPPQGPPTAVPYAAPSTAAPGYPPYGAYPPPPHAGGYYPPPGGYPAPGGYPQQVQQPQKPKKNNFGMGLGAGLLGGAIGGLLLGEAVDDIYDSGYDAGFDDSGFDF